MENVKVIGLSPNRSNIHLSVLKNVTLVNLIKPITDKLKKEDIGYPKTLLFCRTYNDCNLVYDELVRLLGPHITYPPGYPVVRAYRMVDPYTRGSTDECKEAVLKEFISDKTHLRIVVATSAFGMGIDCPDIGQVIHWGSPSLLEEFVQESGRAGRNSKPCHSVLAFHKLRHNVVSLEMAQYADNTTLCRRRLLYQNFLFNTTN